MIGAKFYPRTLTLLGLLTGSMTLMWGGALLLRNVVAVSEALGVPALGWVLGIAAGLVAAMAGIAAIVFIMPLLHQYLRQRPTLELREEGLVFVVGLGKAREIPWEDVAEVRAKKLAGRLGLGGVIINLVKEQRSLGKELFIPHLFLDQDVYDVAAAIEPLVPTRQKERGRRRPRRS